MKEISWNTVSEFHGPEDSPGFLLWQVSIRWRRLVEAALATLDLTHVQFVLLASVGWLTRGKSQVTQIEIARHCGTDITMTSQVLRSLERKGLIERVQHEGNQRAKFPHLTLSGRELVKQAIPLVESVDHSFFESLGDDLKVFKMLMHKQLQKN